VPKRGYLKRLVRAHRLHHAVRTREDCISFGFLYAAPIARLRREFAKRISRSDGRLRSASVKRAGARGSLDESAVP
jgi:beta-carotene 3-hydroxylase